MSPSWTLVLLSISISSINCFNIDVKRAVVHRNTRDTYFGYSLTFYKEDDLALLIVGAPRAQTAQLGVRKGGAVYRCDVNHPKCSQIFFDREGNERRLNGSVLLPIEEKSNQWLGATVVSSKKGRSILACAPHYKYFFSKFDLIEPVGTCFYARDKFKILEEFAPCRQEPARHGHHRFGYGMCGFSAAIPEKEAFSRLYISAPGVYYFQGTTFVQNIDEKERRPNLADGPAAVDHSLLGYSTTTGDFNGDGIDDFAVGVVKGDHLLGFVALYDHRLANLLNLTNSDGQRGSFFGASVTATDVNGDGFDDVIVGIPFYTEYNRRDETQQSKPKYDVGRVKVFFQSKDHSFRESAILEGHTEWSRFGYSVAAVGDLNGDGLNDIIVGAPYGGRDGRGAVYVYHGSWTGIREEFTQKIEASQVDANLKTFGFSLTGGVDVDDNEYPDIAVGAWQSNKAIVFKAKPVVRVTGRVRPNKDTIDLDDKICSTDQFGYLAWLDIGEYLIYHIRISEKLKYCVKYEGKNAPSTLNLDMRLQLDSKVRVGARAFFLEKDFRNRPDILIPARIPRPPAIIVQTVRLFKNSEHCEFHDFYVPDTIRDKLSPIAMMINFTYDDTATDSSSFGALPPAVDNTVPQSFTSQIEIRRNCGSDNRCVPDLKLKAKADKDTFTVGAVDNALRLEVSIKNLFEDAYESQFFITVPRGFEYSGIDNKGKQPVSCSPPDDKEGDYVFVCDVGNPLIRNAHANFDFLITAVDVDPSEEFVVVKMHTNSTNSEDDRTESDNIVELLIPLKVEAQLSLTGRSNPEQLDYSSDNITAEEQAVFDSEVGPLVSHLYQVTNRGPSAINGAILDIFWPSFTASGDHLLYLIDIPFVNDKNRITCRIKENQNINPASLTIVNEHEPDFSSVLFRRKRLKKHGGNGNNDNNNNVGNIGRIRAEFKESVRKVKHAGTAVEYRNGLSRASVNCDDLDCTHIECDIRALSKDNYVLVEVFARLWANTLIDGTFFQADISSLAVAKVTTFPTGSGGYSPPSQITTVTTYVNPTDAHKVGRGVPWWLWLIAILIGIAILFLLILCLWRCGFFERTRPPTQKASMSRGFEPTPEHFAFSGGDTGYVPAGYYSSEKHGDRL